MKKHLVLLCLSTFAALGVVALGAGPATAASPSPTSSCTAQLSQGGTPHGASAADPGFLGEFVSGLAKADGGFLGDLTSSSAAQHGDLFFCVSGVPPLD